MPHFEMQQVSLALNIALVICARVEIRWGGDSSQLDHAAFRHGMAPPASNNLQSSETKPGFILIFGLVNSLFYCTVRGCDTVSN